MLIKFTYDGGGAIGIELRGPLLRAFAHSMYIESVGGAEWDELSDEETQEMIQVFEDLHHMAETGIKKEEKWAAENEESSGHAEQTHAAPA